MKNALLVYPRQPPTYWGANFALDILGVKSAFPPFRPWGCSPSPRCFRRSTSSASWT